MNVPQNFGRLVRMAHLRLDLALQALAQAKAQQERIAADLCRHSGDVAAVRASVPDDPSVARTAARFDVWANQQRDRMLGGLALAEAETLRCRAVAAAALGRSDVLQQLAQIKAREAQAQKARRQIAEEAPDQGLS
ncbi:hypothetical protein CCR83_09025 [Rhodobacter veldkampii DSM 11550]|uniref:Flagellar FliJ protein n=1 Tax=Phaeovulum veldkampii DSM 11550 TaxID=1185920 RepID=A0A2T4JLJ7_9RHOB|nr:hypothetical protein [Phaeovulum veldkampii]MBK5946568.1 hypothetical protein [Phaeovulum veldkampii DSM 11550]PTE18742.1 hypothetical protein C5F46_02355 [Phaeovulum veldkampii DSM 11550]TDQ60047.1 hypothetical protein EV658_107146 [Phaeovulum veldkampii DSM 11550]